MATTPIKGVIFDMDGLLLDTEQLYFDAFRHARTQLGLAPDDDLFRAMVGTNFRLGQDILERGLAGQTDPIAFNDIWDGRIAEMLADGIAAKPGVADLATHLTNNNIPYIIATSTRTVKARDHLDRAGIGHLFDSIIGGETVANSKPAPDIFLKAAATLGLPPAHCAAFEDSENGVRAAHAAGCQVVQVPDVVPPSAALSALGHIIAPSLLEGAHALGLMELAAS